ncbi:MAG: protein tyrosine phosphatase [Fimbriimonadaceae bacterium]
MKILFVCGRNLQRSPTAARIFASEPGMSVRSGGTAKSSARRVSADDLRWADLVLVMEERYSERLWELFPEAMEGVVVRSLEIPDDYKYMDPELVEEIRFGVAGVLREMGLG